MVSDAHFRAAMRRLVAREEREKLSRKFGVQRKIARLIRDKFKPRKADRGEIILVGRDGKRLKAGSKKVSIPVYVARTGRKRLYVRTQIKNPFALRPADNIKLSSAKNLRQVTKRFEVRRLKEVGRGKLIRASKARKKVASPTELAARKKGVKLKPGEYSESYAPKRGKAFDQKMVETLAQSIGRALRSQASKQVYLITALAAIDGQYGKDVVQITFSLGRSEQYFFKESPRSFVRNAFYASFAQQLAFLGYVTSGSANHIRKVTGESTVTQQVWEDYHGEKGRNMAWTGQDFNIVDLTSLEWKIERT